MNNRQFIIAAILLAFTVIVTDFALDTIKLIMCQENIYSVRGIVTYVDGDTATIVDRNGDYWLIDGDFEKCDSVELVISDNGTANNHDDYIVSAEQRIKLY